MESRGLVPAAVLCALVGGCLPSRDNAHDPNNAPFAALIVIDRTLPNGSCPVDIPGQEPAGGLEVLSVNRGRCIALDARESGDPQDDPLTFTYAILTSGDWIAIEGTGALLALSREYVATLPIDVPIELRVTVQPAGGGVDANAETSVVLESRGPMAVSAPPLTLPLGGFPWAPGDFVVPFDGSPSFDPDGDDIRQWCWTFTDLGERRCSTDVADPIFTRVLPASVRATYTAVLEVCDDPALVCGPDAVSDPVLHRVRVGEPATWMKTFESLELLDGARERLPAPPTTIGYLAARYERAGEPERVALFNREGAEWKLSVSESPALSPASAPFTVSDYPLSVTADGPNRRIWSRMINTIQAWNVDPAAMVITTAFTPLAISQSYYQGLGPASFAIQATDADGNGWFTVRGGTYLLEILPDGSDWAEHGVEGKEWTGVAARPATGEMWALREVADDVDTPVDAELVRFVPGEDPQVFALDGHSFADGLAWADANHVWLQLINEALVLVDVRTLLDGDPFELAVDVWVPQVRDGLRVVADPLTGSAWVIPYYSGDRYIVERSGAVLTVPATSSSIGDLQFIDSDGLAWLVDGATLERAASFSGDGIESRTSVTSNYSSAPDGTGGVWTSLYFPNALVHIAQDGSVRRVVSQVRRGDALVTLPNPYHYMFVVSQDGKTAWGWGNDSPLYYYDLEPEIPRQVEVPVDRSQFSAFASRAGIRVAGQPDVFWAVSGFGEKVFTVATNGEMHERYSYATEQSVEVPPAAVSPATNRLCLATYATATSTLNVRRIAMAGTGGSMELLGSVSIVDPGNVIVRATAQPDDMCWVMYRDPSNDSVTVLGWDDPGAPFRSFSDPGPHTGFLDFLPTSSDRVWMLLHTQGEQEMTVSRVDADGAGALVYRVDYDTPSFSTFSAPGATFTFPANF